MRDALNDASPVFRIEAASALTKLGEVTEALPLLARELRSGQPDVALYAARALQLLGDGTQPVWPVMREILERARCEEETVGDPAMYLRFSLEPTAVKGSASAGLRGRGEIKTAISEPQAAAEGVLPCGAGEG